MCDIMQKLVDEGVMAAREETFREGRESMLTDIVVSMLKKCKSPATIAEDVDVSVETVLRIAKANNLVI